MPIDFTSLNLEELDIHNQFKESIPRFKDHDPHLRRLSHLPLIYHSPLLDEPIFNTPGIYLITGGRQIGKTTFLKQIISKLLSEKTAPKDILFITGEIIDTHHILRRIIDIFHDESSSLQYLFIDEVNTIPDWDKSIKYLVDSGILERTVVILTGSDSQIIKTSMKRLAGRRGKAERTDFVFHPLNFKEFVCLKDETLSYICTKIMESPLTEEFPDYSHHHDKLTSLFFEYLLHGGYLPAVNEYALTKTISKATMNTYLHWIVGDILRYNKSEHYLSEIFRGILSTYTSPVSWNNLSRFLSIEHHQTIADYCGILSSIHVLLILEAIMEHKLTGAPKKNKKLVFRDPFIHHSISFYLDQKFQIEKIKTHLKNNEFASRYVEAAAVAHCKRWFPTYYIKGPKGEVDLALVQENRIFPIEVKWTKRLRPEDLKQIKEYRNGLILTPSSGIKKIDSVTAVPLVKFLIHITGTQLNIG